MHIINYSSLFVHDFFFFCKIYIQWNTQNWSVPPDEFWQMHLPVHANSLSRYRTSTPTPESSLSCIYFYVFIFDKCMCPCNHHLNQDREHFQYLERFPHDLVIHSIFPELTTPLTLSLYILFAHYWNLDEWNLLFYVWLFVFIIMSVTQMHVVLSIAVVHSFLLQSSIPLNEYTIVYSFYCWWVFEFVVWCYYEQSCQEHLHTWLSPSVS